MSSRTAAFLFVPSAAIVWYGIIWTGHLAPTVLPPPHLVVALMAQEWKSLLWNTYVTLTTAVTGYFFANVVAISMAIAFLYSDALKSLATPWVVVLKNLPIISVASLLIISFGDSPVPRILVVILICFHPILANLIKGFEQVDPNLIARFQTLHASRFQLFRYVLWPNALPYYAAAHEVAFTSSIVAAVLAEFFFSRQGLGFMLTQAMNDYRGDRLWATNIIIATLSAAALGLSVLAERVLIPWQPKGSKSLGKTSN
ncbi:MAG: ABC transporter permease [Verrucomicrobia bacterium]|nr:ABC transporter permease [Verrucomicrobiota bacterium]